MQIIVLAISVLVLSLPLTVDAEDDDALQADPATPSQQYLAILKQYNPVDGDD